MSLPQLTFTKSWTAPASQSGRYLPTIEPSEEQAREDLQVQHDDTAAWALELITALGQAENLGANDNYSAIGENIANVKAALLSLKEQLNNIVIRSLPNHSIKYAQLDSMDITGGTAPVHTDNIQNGAVTSAKLANGAVGSDNIGYGAVIAGKLATGTGANAPVGPDNIQENAIKTRHVTDGQITSAKLSSTANTSGAAVATANIQNKAVTNDKLADSGLDASKLTTGLLDSARLSNIPATALAGGIPNTKLDTTCVKSVNGNVNAVVTHLMKSGTSTEFETMATPTLTDYPCRASVSDNQITQNDKVYVEFNATQINDGIYAPITISYNGGFYVYAEEVPPSPSTVTVDYTIFKKGTQ